MSANLDLANVCDVLCLGELPVEFPDCEVIRRRTAAFQRRFVEHFLALYSSLTPSIQTSALSVAVRRRSVNHAGAVTSSSSSSLPDVVVSLQQYLDAPGSCADVPLQLPASEYALTVSPAHFDLVRRARVEGCSSTDPVALARHIAADVASEAAGELLRAYEYQIVLLGDEKGLAARLGAQRGAERAMDYLRTTSRHVDVNCLLRGVVEGGLPVLISPATVSVIIGPHRELHWNLDHMFSRPGLRRERLLVAGGEFQGGLGEYGAIPWRFYASTEHGTDAVLYGYRGQLLARDFHAEWLRGGRQPLYHLDVDEETFYDLEVPARTDDFHRVYRPYRRLVGSALIASYHHHSGVGLSEFVQRLHGDAFRRDDVEPVFRPLTPKNEFSAPRVTHDANHDDFTSPEFRGARASNAMPKNDIAMCGLSRMSAVEESVPTSSSTTFGNNSRARDHSASDQVRLEHSNGGLRCNESCGELRVSALTSTWEACAGGNIISSDQPADCSMTTSKRRAPPPAVKPKPSLELRRRLSTNVSNSQSSLPVTQRQSSTPVKGSSDSSPEVTVRFPTVEELFGRELAAIRRFSALLAAGAANSNNHPASTLLTQHTGSINMTSSATTNDVTSE